MRFRKWHAIVAAVAGIALVVTGAFVLFWDTEAVRCAFYSGFLPGDAYGVSWSPTGSEIAFGRADGFAPDILRVKIAPLSKDLKAAKPLPAVADGKPQRIKNGNCASAYPSWSPDGRRIAYAGNSLTGDPYDLWLMNNDGSAARMVARGHGGSTGARGGGRANTAGPKPAWSPDGRELAFDTQDAAGVSAVWSVRVSGQGLRRATPPSMPATRPSWSPDGKRIAFSVTASDTRAGIWVIQIDGSRARQLTHGSDSDPAWSPDGKTVAFDRTEGDHLTIWSVPAAGGREKQLTREDAYLPTWSPDGELIAFTSDRDGDPGLYLMDAQGPNQLPTSATSATSGRATAPGTPLTPRRRVMLVKNAAQQKRSGKVLAVLCSPEDVNASKTRLSFCVVTFAGPSCQLWNVVESEGANKVLPLGEPALGRRGSYDEASGKLQCLDVK